MNKHGYACFYLIIITYIYEIFMFDCLLMLNRGFKVLPINGFTNV